MKIMETVELESVFEPNERGRTALEARVFVDSFFEEYKKLCGTRQGKLLQISVPNDEVKWPSVQQMKAFPRHGSKERKHFQERSRARLRVVLLEIKSRCSAPFLAHNIPMVTHIGDGKVVLWWKFRTKKGRVKSDEGT